MNDIYYGEDLYNAIQHRTHVYIRKEFKNGKWQYYYKTNDHLDKGPGKSLKVLNAFAKVSGMNAKTNAQRAVAKTKVSKSKATKEAAEKAVAKYKATPIGMIDSYKALGQARMNSLIDAWKQAHSHQKTTATGTGGKPK